MKTTIDHTLRQKMGIDNDDYIIISTIVKSGDLNADDWHKIGISPAAYFYKRNQLFESGFLDKDMRPTEKASKYFKSDNGDQIDRVINFLNIFTCSKFSLTKKDSRKSINDRINEGHTFDDFEKVVIFKYNEWKNTDQEQYLRPVTLFGNKFEGYLQGAIKSLPRPSENPRMEGMVM